MTISHISHRTILFGIAVIIALSTLALTFAALHGFLPFGVSHASANLVNHSQMLAAVVRFLNTHTHLVSHGHMLADGGPTPPCNPNGPDCPPIQF